MTPQTIESGATVKLNICAYKKTGWTFAGWATSPLRNVVYSDTSNIFMGSAYITLYAKWNLNKYTITFKKTIAKLPEQHQLKLLILVQLLN